MVDPTLTHNIVGGIARVKANKRITKIQGKLLCEDYERASKKLYAVMKECDGLRLDVEGHIEFGNKLVTEVNDLYHTLDRVLTIKVTGEPVQTKGSVDFAWQAKDSETGVILTSGHATTASLYEAVLAIRLKEKGE